VRSCPWWRKRRRTCNPRWHLSRSDLWSGAKETHTAGRGRNSRQREHRGSHRCCSEVASTRRSDRQTRLLGFTSFSAAGDTSAKTRFPRTNQIKAFELRTNYKSALLTNRPISVYRFPRRALTLCSQLGVGIQPGTRFSARSADALPATLYGHFTQTTCRNRPIETP